MTFSHQIFRRVTRVQYRLCYSPKLPPPQCGPATALCFLPDEMCMYVYVCMHVQWGLLQHDVQPLVGISYIIHLTPPAHYTQ